MKSDFEDQKVKTETQAVRLEHEAEARARHLQQEAAEAVDKGKKKAAAKAKEAKAAIKRDGKKLSENRDNPVFIANSLIWGIGAVAIGYGAYKKHSEGQLDWKLAGTVAGAVAAFGVVDYLASRYNAPFLPFSRMLELISANAFLAGFLRTNTHLSRSKSEQQSALMLGVSDTAVDGALHFFGRRLKASTPLVRHACASQIPRLERRTKRLHNSKMPRLEANSPLQLYRPVEL